MLPNKFKIDTDKIKKRNDELIRKNWINKLDKKQKKFLNWRKGESSLLNKDGLYKYTDLSNYLINPDKFNEINIKDLKSYISLFDIKQQYNAIFIDNIDQDLKKILLEINNKRIKNIQKYIKIEDSIFKKGILSKDTIYRIQKKIINENIIKNSTSWSLVPIDNFCSTEECHLYITKIPNDLKVIYIENNSKDKELNVFNDFGIYEFEYILPRNIEFIEIKTKKIKIPNINFNNKEKEFNGFKDQIIHCHWIKITGKVKNIDFPKVNNVKLII